MNDLEFWLTDTSSTAPPHPPVVAPEGEEKSPSKEDEEEGGRKRKGRKSGKGRKVRLSTAKCILFPPFVVYSSARCWCSISSAAVL